MDEDWNETWNETWIEPFFFKGVKRKNYSLECNIDHKRVQKINVGEKTRTKQKPKFIDCATCGKKISIQCHVSRSTSGHVGYCNDICYNGRVLYGRECNTSNIELILRHALDVLGVRYMVGAHIGKYYPDLYFESHHLIVEVDGNYWHGKLKNRKHDKVRDRYLVKLGYIVKRFSETDVVDRPYSCAVQIQRWLEDISLLESSIDLGI